jgi:phosphatidylinositol glycan class N
LSVFDCYFVSPVVHGMAQHSTAKAQAKRLVLIVGQLSRCYVRQTNAFIADGLRADLVFNTNAFPHIPDTPRIVAPYLRDVMERRGSFGISHTRVPTESRPGHVALIGMF